VVDGDLFTRASSPQPSPGEEEREKTPDSLIDTSLKRGVNDTSHDPASFNRAHLLQGARFFLAEECVKANVRSDETNSSSAARHCDFFYP
jgi:hypothetical protein